MARPYPCHPLSILQDQLCLWMHSLGSILVSLSSGCDPTPLSPDVAPHTNPHPDPISTIQPDRLPGVYRLLSVLTSFHQSLEPNNNANIAFFSRASKSSSSTCEELPRIFCTSLSADLGSPMTCHSGKRQLCHGLGWLRQIITAFPRPHQVSKGLVSAFSYRNANQVESPTRHMTQPACWFASR